MLKSNQFEILFEALETGLNVTDSCNLASISRETYYQRLKDDAEFSESVEKAQLARKRKAIELIHQASEKHWQAAAWWLERKYGSEFGNRNDIKVTTGQDWIEQFKKDMGIDQESLSKMSESELDDA